MWRTWFQKYVDGETVKLIPEAKIGITNVFTYPYSNGGSCQAIGVHHPSARMYSKKEKVYHDRWNPEIEKFLAY